MSPVSNDSWRYGGGNAYRRPAAVGSTGELFDDSPSPPMHHFRAYNTRSAFESRLETLANIIRTVGPAYNLLLVDYGFFGGLVRNPEKQHKDCDCMFFFPHIDHETILDFAFILRQLKNRLEANDQLFSFFDIFFTDGQKVYVFSPGCSGGWKYTSYDVVPFLKHKPREFYIGNHSKRLVPQIDGNIRIDRMVESFGDRKN